MSIALQPQDVYLLVGLINEDTYPTKRVIMSFTMYDDVVQAASVLLNASEPIFDQWGSDEHWAPVSLSSRQMTAVFTVLWNEYTRERLNSSTRNFSQYTVDALAHTLMTIPKPADPNYDVEVSTAQMVGSILSGFQLYEQEYPTEALGGGDARMSSYPIVGSALALPIHVHVDGGGTASYFLTVALPPQALQQKYVDGSSRWGPDDSVLQYFGTSWQMPLVKCATPAPPSSGAGRARAFLLRPLQMALLAKGAWTMDDEGYLDDIAADSFNVLYDSWEDPVTGNHFSGWTSGLAGLADDTGLAVHESSVSHAITAPASVPLGPQLALQAPWHQEVISAWLKNLSGAEGFGQLPQPTGLGGSKYLMFPYLRIPDEMDLNSLFGASSFLAVCPSDIQQLPASSHMAFDPAAPLNVYELLDAVGGVPCHHAGGYWYLAVSPYWASVPLALPSGVQLFVPQVSTTQRWASDTTVQVQFDRQAWAVVAGTSLAQAAYRIPDIMAALPKLFPSAVPTQGYINADLMGLNPKGILPLDMLLMGGFPIDYASSSTRSSEARPWHLHVRWADDGFYFFTDPLVSEFRFHYSWWVRHKTDPAGSGIHRCASVMNASGTPSNETQSILLPAIPSSSIGSLSTSQLWLAYVWAAAPWRWTFKKSSAMSSWGLDSVSAVYDRPNLLVWPNSAPVSPGDRGTAAPLFLFDWNRYTHASIPYDASKPVAYKVTSDLDTPSGASTTSELRQVAYSSRWVPSMSGSYVTPYDDDWWHYIDRFPYVIQ